jgi:phytoene dehydrogenase-like protein
MPMKFDVVIIGSGLGGLQCGYILSREGFSVCILEKNSQLGGCLQTFSRRGTVFDTGMHYIGSMDQGQILHDFFRFFGLNERLKLKKMDETGYDIVKYNDREYRFAMGFDRFTETMLSYFPDEREALVKYTDKLQQIGDSANLLKIGDSTQRKTGYLDYFSIGIDDYLNSLTRNRTLRNVILGLSPLYAGVREKTPLYIPMIIHSSFARSAYRFIDGGSQISSILSEDITGNGGTIRRNAEVTDLIFGPGNLQAVKINGSEVIEANNFISNIHPLTLLRMSPDGAFRPAYRNRLESISDTCGVFTLFLSMKENAFEYLNNNYYVFRTGNIWDAPNYSSSNWPPGYMMHFTPSSGNVKYAGAIIVNTYMRWEDVARWSSTTVGKRGDDYNDFKNSRAEKLLDALENDFPGIRSKTDAYYASTPLTYRDYIGSPTGSIYGMQKDYKDPLRTIVMPRTSIPNLFMTGQNINIHGVIGVTICSVLTCCEILGTEYLINKMRAS